MRERVHERLFAGYAETNDVERGTVARERRDLYRLATHLPALVWFSAWRSHLPDRDLEAVASTYREYVQSFGA